AMFLPFHLFHNPWFQLALCIPVYAIGLRHFGRSAYHSLRSGVPNMDVLITLGSSAAFFYSLTGTLLNLGHDYQFYETSASIITIVMLGNVLEHLSVKKTTSALDSLMRLKNTKAKRMVGETIEEVDAEKLMKGDIILVNTGDHIPVDGVLIWGNGSADESIITGESFAVEKFKGDKVTGGTILLSGSIKMKALAVGNETVLSSIIEMVRKAKEEKPAFQHLADKVSMIFVPVVVSIALLTFILSYFAFPISLTDSILRAIAVLVIACPCAMGLAIPTAVMVGVGHAARKGILIKGGVTLEKFSKINSIAFDKTGTLTTGKFKINQIDCLGNYDLNYLKGLIYSIEKHSSHPLAKSIEAELQGASLVELLDLNEDKGFGMKAKDLSGNDIRLGSYRYAGKGFENTYYDVFLLINDKPAAGILIADELRPEAFEVVKELKRQKVSSFILSGDREPKVASIAKAAGITEFYAALLPQQKLDMIKSRSENLKIAMIGDGVNDAPSLTAAEIGVSFGNASPIAIESADIVLLGNHLQLINKALHISRLTLQTMKQNLFWAFIYNIAAIPLAAFGYLNPMIAALSMALSDVVVVGNSLLLYRKKI
ncbi:MAG: heavy metal translocating P-type ATPase, partial [Bacteroidota bacterium]